jgi:uncharacterized NAD(P)/FAD-binding protein YdhS
MADRIVIIGGGFAGAVTALKIASSMGSAAVTIVEPRAELGRGIAYATTDLDHLVNGPARVFGLYPDDAGHLPRWLANHPARRGWPGPPDGNYEQSVPPRVLYGDYVGSQLASVGIRHVTDKAVNITPEFEVVLASGRKLRADKVVLATGLTRNETSFDLPDEVRTGGRYIGDPWAGDAYDAIGSGGDVAIVGSGLTMLDVVISLEKRGFRGRYFTFSRRGLLVRSRREVEAWPLPGWQGSLPRTALGLLRAVRQELSTISAAGDDWQRLVLSLRPFVEELWAGAEDAERRRFLRHLRSYWDLAFHRAVPESIAWLDRVRSRGRFANVMGRVQALAPAPDSRIALTWHPRGADEGERHDFDHVVNAAGYVSDWRRASDPLARNLVASGQVRPHAIGLGIDADPTTGAVIAADGGRSRRLFAVGHPLRGAAWEASSIPEQIEGATRVARALSASRLGKVA